MHSKHMLFIIICSLFFSCNSYSNDDVSIMGNWIIEEITYNGSHGNWGECGHIENRPFYTDNTFTWGFYALANELGDCSPLPPGESVWDYIGNNTAQLTDDDHEFDVVYSETYLYRDFFIEPNDQEPEGIAIHFVFIKS